jgi:hypothetical protein
MKRNVTPLTDADRHRLAALAARREKKRKHAASKFLAAITRRRLFYIAALRDFASAAAATAPGYDGAPPEIVDVPEPGENPQLRVARNVREHPLDLMAHKQQITTEQFGAGDLYRRDLEMAQISPMTGRNLESIYTVELSNAKALETAALSDMLGPKTFAARGAKRTLVWDDIRPMTLDAMDRANKARLYVERVAGREAAEIVTHVCTDRLSIVELASTRKFGHRNRVGRKLQEALDALADHYGTRPRRGRGGIRSWGDGSHVPRADGAEADESNLEAAE